MYDIDLVIRMMIKEQLTPQERVKLYTFLADVIDTVDSVELGILEGFTHNLAYLTTRIEEINEEELDD